MSRSLGGIVICSMLAIKITNSHGSLDFVNSDGFVMIKLSSEEDHNVQFNAGVLIKDIKVGDIDRHEERE